MGAFAENGHGVASRAATPVQIVLTSADVMRPGIWKLKGALAVFAGKNFIGTKYMQCHNTPVVQFPR